MGREDGGWWGGGGLLVRGVIRGRSKAIDRVFKYIPKLKGKADRQLAGDWTICSILEPAKSRDERASSTVNQNPPSVMPHNHKTQPWTPWTNNNKRNQQTT